MIKITAHLFMATLLVVASNLYAQSSQSKYISLYNLDLYGVLGYKLGGDNLGSERVNGRYQGVNVAFDAGSAFEIGGVAWLDISDYVAFSAGYSLLSSDAIDQYETSSLTKQVLDFTVHLGSKHGKWGLGGTYYHAIKYSQQSENSSLTFKGEDALGAHVVFTWDRRNRNISKQTIRFTFMDYYIPYLDRNVGASTLDYQIFLPIIF